MSSVAAVGLLSAFGFLYINYHYRYHSIIRQSSPRLNNVIVIGCMLSYCCVFVYGAEAFVESLDTHSVICKIRWWMFSLAFTLAFGTMFVKTWRVYKIFTNKQLYKQLGSLHDRHLFGIVCGLVCLDVAYLTAWEITDPITSSHRHLSKDISPDGHDSTQGYFIICTSDNENLWSTFWAIWKSLLLVIGLFLAWETRHVSFPSLNDSKYIGMSVYNVVIMILITVSLSFVVGTNHIQAKYALYTTAFNVISTFTLLLLFVPKIAKIKGGTTYPEQTPDVVNGTTPFNSFCCEQRRHHECPHCKCK
ncbi:hypothetical protein OS493_009207 [Desmophyllum pertusum]|uniref:G-protein coupled receptors family 3 profile domain-containing protein n=1 Tax=Desmophyllum pertusum TaxID=174260 RepID=A0A9W9Z507_9CNID|nr:hypothetical protein OS493_009207 [Desmophyllum pertusum]